jgi:hypothetical protein
MTCRRARPLLPLAAGGDLSSARDKRLQAHLRACRDCRQELELYQKSLEEMKSLARTEVPADWPESEWRAIVRRATSPGLGRRRPLFPESRRLAWTMGAALALLLLAAVVILLDRGRSEKAIPPFSPGAPAGRVEAKKQTPQPRPQSRPGQPAAGPKSVRQRPLPVAGRPVQPAVQAQASPKQSITNMVFVSSESGLTIHWVLNSEFEWKEKR